MNGLWVKTMNIHLTYLGMIFMEKEPLEGTQTQPKESSGKKINTQGSSMTKKQVVEVKGGEWEHIDIE